MTNGLVYFNNGTKCLLRLAVSLKSLREHYDGPVTILDGDGQGAVKAIAKDGDADVQPVAIKQLRRHTAYSAKPKAIGLSPYDTTVFLDADTTVHGAIDELFNLANQTDVVVTQFSDWMTNKPMIAKRLRKFIGASPNGVNVNGSIERLTTDHPAPALNTGVVATYSQNLCSFWEAMTAEREGEFIADEVAMQLTTDFYQSIVLTDEWNFSPLYGKAREPRIVHYHGKKHTRPEALTYWRAPFIDAWFADFGGIQSLTHYDPALKDPAKLKELT